MRTNTFTWKPENPETLIITDDFRCESRTIHKSELGYEKSRHAIYTLISLGQEFKLTIPFDLSRYDSYYYWIREKPDLITVQHPDDDYTLHTIPVKDAINGDNLLLKSTVLDLMSSGKDFKLSISRDKNRLFFHQL